LGTLAIAKSPLGNGDNPTLLLFVGAPVSFYLNRFDPLGTTGSPGLLPFKSGCGFILGNDSIYHEYDLAGQICARE